MRILSRLERFDIRRLLSGMIVTVGLIVLLVLCFGIPCRNAFCSSPVKVSGIVANPSEVVKTKMNHSSEYEEGTRNNDSSRENVVAISNVKVELNASLIPSPNVSLGKPEMAVDSSVLVRSNDDSRESNVLPIMRRHKQVAATVSISQMNSLLIQSLPSSHSPVRVFFIVDFSHLRLCLLDKVSNVFSNVLIFFFFFWICRSLVGHLLETLKCSLPNPRLRMLLLFMSLLDSMLPFIEISPSS